MEIPNFYTISSLERAKIVKNGLNMVPVGVACFIMGGGCEGEPHGTHEFFMIKRKGSHGEGTWSVPGGWIDAGEHPHSAVDREIWEEAGIKVRKDVISERGWTYTRFDEGIDNVCLWFMCEYYTGFPRNTYPEKIEAYGWFSRDYLPKPLFKGFEDMLKKGWIVP